MDKNLEKVKLLARDLRDGKKFPRSPRQTLAGYVLAGRAVDKCRAMLVDWKGEYHSNCPLDQRWLNFAEIDYGDFRSLVATGATDEEIAEWIEKNAKKRPRAEIVAWNNKERDLRLSDLPHELQEFMENYIHRYVPRNRVVYHWFDVYDLEEQRIRLSRRRRCLTCEPGASPQEHKMPLRLALKARFYGREHNEAEKKLSRAFS